MRSASADRRATVPWDEIRRRVEAAGRAVEGTTSPTPEQARAVLEARAQMLARPIDPPAAGDGLNLLTFTVRNEIYAVESRFVLEMFRPVEVAPLLAAEQAIFGVTLWRGELLLVIDLPSLLGLPPLPTDECPIVLTLGLEHPVLGIPVDAPGEIYPVPAGELRPPPDGIAGRDYLRGTVGDAVLVLDVERVLPLAGPEPV